MTNLRIAVYHNLHSGGAKRVVIEQLYRLAKHHVVTLFTLSTADQKFAVEGRSPFPSVTTEYRQLPIARSPFGRLNPILRFIDLLRHRKLAQKIARQIDDGGFDVVLVHPCQITQSPYELRWLRTPTVYYCHELPRRLYEPPISRPSAQRCTVRKLLDRIDPLPIAYNSILKRIDKYNAMGATRIVCNSKYTRENIAQAYQREAGICYPAVAADVFRPFVSERQSFVLSVGALTPSKGFDFIILALSTLPSSERPKLVVVSNYQEPAELEYLTNLARNLGVGLDCRSGLSDSELQLLYAQAGCVAYAPIREPLGLVALEAMAAGAAVVGVAEGGVTETIAHDRTGVLALREPAAFGQAVRQLLANPDYALQLGNAGRQQVMAHWTWEQHVASLSLILEQTAHSK